MANGKDNNLANKISPLIPTLDNLEGRFSFIQDNTLRINTALAFQYIIFLVAVLDREKIEGTTIANAAYKDMIVYTATIVEGCLHYCLKRYIDEGVVESRDVMPTEWDTKNHKEMYKISAEEQVYWVIKYKKTEKFTSRTTFVAVNRACKKADILTERFFKKAEKLREKRNKIHLAGLKNVDLSYNKIDAQDAFNVAKEIIERVEGLVVKLDEEK